MSNANPTPMMPLRLATALCSLLSWMPALLQGAAYDSPSPSSSSQRIVWPEGRRGALSLSFDDARPSQVDQGIPLFNQLDLKATFYVSPARVRERLEGWRAAVAHGHEIGNHSLHHPCTANFAWSRPHALEDYTLDQMRDELIEANALIESLLGVKPTTFAYPCGQTFVGRGAHTRSYVALIGRLFAAGRGFLSETSNDPAFCDPAQLMAVACDELDFAQVKPLLEQARERGQWLVLAGHEIADKAERQTTRVAMLRELGAYVKDPSCGLWVDRVDHIAAFIHQSRSNAPASAGVAVRKPLNASQRDRIDQLLREMTLEEKVGQLNMPCVYEGRLGNDVAAKTEACRKFAAGTWVEGIGPGGGFFTLANTILLRGPRQQAEYFNELQRIALERTRLKIPLLQTEEGTHGLMCSGGTIFPEGLAIGSTWDLPLVRALYEVAAREARAVGIHQLFTLVVEPNRDPRLGRNQEGYGEDPYLGAQLARTIVGAVQGADVSAPDKVVAGLCHYPGQSQPVSGLERGAMEVSERQLREVFLPPWVAGIRDAGALGVMATYPAIDGKPTHGSAWILTDLLRHELQFQGLVLCEGGGLGTVIYEGLADSMQAAGILNLRAGVDVGISFEDAYLRDLVSAVTNGRIAAAFVDRAVRRVLEQKTRLGLFEKPFVDADRAERVSHTPEHQELARQVAREGIVLLKNARGLLPLRKDLRRVAVIGPNADNPRNQLGDYVSHTVLQDVVTVLEGIRGKLSPGVQIDYVKGCNVTRTDLNEIEKAVAAAKAAEAAIVVLGENEWQAGDRQGTDGEGFDVATLELTGLQSDLIRAVQATGTPTVLVLINGRPLAIRWEAEHVDAIVEAWLPGEKGGEAVADVLFGDHNPSGRLTITFPRHAGQLPVYYNHKPSKAYWLKDGWGKPYADLNPEPLYCFGHGLSYTEFTYSNLRLERASLRRGESVQVQVEVKNTGNRAGSEVVQLYLRDLVGSVVTPVKELRGFAKIKLDPGEQQSVSLSLSPEDLALLDDGMRWVVEPGEFEVMVGRSSQDIRLRAKFAVTE